MKKKDFYSEGVMWFEKKSGDFRSLKNSLNSHFYLVDHLKLGIDSNIPRVKVVTCFYFATF